MAAPALRRLRAGRMPDVVFAVGVSVALVAVAAANGGYFPTSWGWAALGFAWAALVALVAVRPRTLTVEGALFLFATVAFTAWTLASVMWSRDVGHSVAEAERMMVYLSAVGALLFLGRGRSRVLLASLLSGVTLVCAYSLATRVFPARVGRFNATAGYRLFTPLGYWNSLGLFAAMGCLLATGFVARGKSLAARGAAAASLVLLVPTIFFTFSRGSWLALGIALVFVIAFDPRRLQTSLAVVVAGVAPAIAVLLASRSHALTTMDTPLTAAVHDGHRLAVAVLVLMAIATLLGIGFGLAERAYVPSRGVRFAYATVLVLAVAVAASGVMARWGSPPTLAKKTWHAFSAPPVSTGDNLNSRLFHLSSNGRLDLWRAAIRESRSAPFVGTGAGTFDLWWAQHRRQNQQVIDAHSLYLETLGELGIVGLALLVIALVASLVGAWRSRRLPLVPFAAAALVAWIVHAGIDWDWEIVAVTLLALACATTLVDARTPRAVLQLRYAAAGAVAAAVIAVFALVVTMGNKALASAEDALQQGQPGKAELDAKRAARWMPWASDPLVLVGELEIRSGRKTKGLATLQRAVAKAPHSYVAWYALASAEKGASQRRAAAHVVRLNPLSDEAAEMRQILARRP